MSIRFETTPNPDALKCVLPAPRSGAMISASNPGEADGDLLALELLAIPGVTRVLLHTEFVTVCKDTDANWLSIKRAVTRALTDG